ncbi:MAG: DUF2851 family protein [Fidelibacterota bacterium]|nr:MAG: DUF2851 family protein [Candidatus Neomarinimicrobiota bacterium]
MIESNPYWTAVRREGQHYGPQIVGAISDREADLHTRWERIAGRNVWGLGGKYQIVHQGKRNGGPGPDFLDAVILFPDGRMRRGDVEIHLRREGWRQHGHQWDPRYRQVILHVISTGSLEAVPQEWWRAVPTLLLPGEPASLQSLCETIPLTLSDFRAQPDFLRTLAMQRWWRRLADWSGRDSQDILKILARRLGPDHHRLALANLWLASLPGEGNLFSFLSNVMACLPVETIGSIRKELPGRVLFLSALAFSYHRQPRTLASWSLDEIQQLARDLQAGSWPTPTRSFLIEVVGNWLLFLGSVKTGSDRFDEWYLLPLGWSYGRVRRHVERLGLQRPSNFGQQQGLLEWIESLCKPVECDCCPVAGAMSGL